MTRLLVVAAGTGGHVYPALAVAERLRSMGVDVSWLGTAVGIESRLVPAAGFPFHVSKVAGLRGKGIARWLAAPLLRSCAPRSARSRCSRGCGLTWCSAWAATAPAPGASWRG